MTVERRRYRKISIRVWGDERFRKLSKPKPNAQTLWFYLLTGPHTSALPGLFVSGEASLAEALGWPLPAFRACFKELTDLSMALADWENRVVWLPKAVVHNAPESPNVVTSWVSALDEIPECHMKRVAAESFKDFIEGIGEGFRKALAKGWPKGLSTTPVNQEQEHEQEQEQEQTSAPLEGFAEFWEAYPRHIAKADAEKAWKGVKNQRPATSEIVASVRQQAASADWRKEAGKFIPYPATWIRARRWEDEPGVEPRDRRAGPAYDGGDWFEECKRVHGGACELDRHRHMSRMLTEKAS